jgi:hypothetical protein
MRKFFVSGKSKTFVISLSMSPAALISPSDTILLCMASAKNYKQKYQSNHAMFHIFFLNINILTTSPFKAHATKSA